LGVWCAALITRSGGREVLIFGSAHLERATTKQAGKKDIRNARPLLRRDTLGRTENARKIRKAFMEMAYRERWEAEIAEMRRVLASLAMNEERKWGKPTYTIDGKNIVILQGFKEYFALGFFKGALLKDRKNVLVQLGQVQAGRVMKFTSAKEITAKAATIKAYVREAIAVEEAGLQVKKRTTSDLPVPEELKERLRRDPRFKRAFEALTPGRQRSYLYHFGAAKHSATRVARIEKAMSAIFEGKGFLERR
jgi:uncharacterized protein YdeI (YjbR/CyaY-like superfamily)